MQIVIFEKRPRWMPELERQFAGEMVRIRSFRGIRDVESIARSPETVITVLDLEGGAAECLQLLGRMVHRPAEGAVLVVGSKQTRSLEWSVRELGALHFIWQQLSGDDLAEFCRRQAEMFELRGSGSKSADRFQAAFDN